MNISQAAIACGLPSKTIRYYEALGLVVPGREAGNEYRLYSLEDVDHLRFLQRARVAGFSLDECGELLALYANPARRSADVKAALLASIHQVDQQLIALNALRQTLVQMADECARGGVDAGAIYTSPANQGFTSMPFTLIDTPNEQ